MAVTLSITTGEASVPLTRSSTRLSSEECAVFSVTSSTVLSGMAMVRTTAARAGAAGAGASSSSFGSTRFTSAIALRATSVVMFGRSPVSGTISGSTLAILPRTRLPSCATSVTSVPAGMFSIASARVHEGATVSATMQLMTNDAKRDVDMRLLLRLFLEQGLCRSRIVSFPADLERSGSDLVTDDLESEVHSRIRGGWIERIFEYLVHARCGRSIAVAGVKGRPREAYFGAVGGGLWKTTDAGNTWAPVTDGQINSSSVGAVAVSESHPDIVFIGMGENCIRGNIMPGDGVYKSTDAGKTWAYAGFREVDAISKIRIHPTNPDIVYVAAFGLYYGPSEERGVFKSTDGGKTWKRTLFKDPRTGAADIVIDANNPNVIYAALWEAYRIEYQMSSGGPGSGIYKSTDGGDTWTEITRNPGLPAGVVGRIGLANTKADSNRVYALIENENGGLFASDDAGASWKLINASRAVRQRAFYYTHVFADPSNKDVVYMQNVGLFRSTDGGKTTVQVGQGTHGDHHDLWISPDDPNHVIDGNDGGGAITYNISDRVPNWSEQDFPTAQWYHVITTAHLPFHVCGSQQDNSTLCVPSNTNMPGQGFGGNPPVAPYQAGGGEPGYIATHATDPDIFFGGTNNGSFLTRLNRRTGEFKEVGAYPRFFSGEPSRDVKERWQWTYPIIFSYVDPKILYTSSQRVWMTTNGGDTWTAISGDLSRHDPKTMNESGGPITHDMNSPEIYGTVFSLAPGKKDVNLIWAGSDDGVIHVTRR